MEPIDIRGHHLETLGKNYNLQQLTDLLVPGGYMKEGDSFADSVYKIFREIKTNPGRLVRITDSPDAICLMCSKKKDCENPRENPAPEDRQVARWLKFEIGKVYTAKEVMQSFEQYRSLFDQFGGKDK